MFPDFRRLRLTRDGNTLFGVAQFNGARTFGLTGDENATLLIDIDIDQDPSTGFLPIYDFIFSGEGQPESGMGGEYLIGIDPLPDLADSAYVGELLDDGGGFAVRDGFLPGVCGPYFGFDTDYLFETVGDDGLFDVTVLSFAFAEAGARLDASPEDGHFSLDLSGAPAIVRRGMEPRVTTIDRRWHRTWPWPGVRRR
jgi:hypothetical protein